jgi:hypothetical protein
MSWPVISLPPYEVLLNRIKESTWVDFYLKNDYFTGSSESIALINQLKNKKWQDQHSIGGEEIKKEKNSQSIEV